MEKKKAAPKKKNKYALADKINREILGHKTVSPALKKQRKEGEAMEKKFNKDYDKYIKERSERYKREGISE